MRGLLRAELSDGGADGTEAETSRGWQDYLWGLIGPGTVGLRDEGRGLLGNKVGDKLLCPNLSGLVLAPTTAKLAD